MFAAARHGSTQARARQDSTTAFVEFVERFDSVVGDKKRLRQKKNKRKSRLALISHIFIFAPALTQTLPRTFFLPSCSVPPSCTFSVFFFKLPFLSSSPFPFIFFSNPSFVAFPLFLREWCRLCTLPGPHRAACSGQPVLAPVMFFPPFRTPTLRSFF